MKKYTLDELMKCGELTKAARLFAKGYYENGKMGYTRKLLIEELADKVDQYERWNEMSSEKKFQAAR